MTEEEKEVLLFALRNFFLNIILTGKKN